MVSKIAITYFDYKIVNYKLYNVYPTVILHFKQKPGAREFSFYISIQMDSDNSIPSV